MAKDKKISVVYVGRRFTNDGKLVFQFERGDEVYRFRRIRWVIIGHSYFAIETGNEVSISTVPDCDDSAAEPSEADLQKWQIEDTLARNMQERKRLAARMDKSPALDHAVNTIRPLLRGLNHSQHWQLVEILVAKARIETKK